VANGIVYVSGIGADTYAYALRKSSDVLWANAHPPARALLHPNMALPIAQ
jgi:hypothetical protein